jgi:hypothetical protein
VGLLDDLKAKADALRARHTVDLAAMERNTALTESACRSIFAYLNALAQHLNVLTPQSPVRFEIDPRNVASGFTLSDFHIDARRGRLRNNEIVEHIYLHWQLRSGQQMQLTREFPAEIERIESRLRLAGVETMGESVRNPDNGKLMEMRFAFVADFRANVRVMPEHDRGRIRFVLTNVDPLETINAEFAATDVGTPRLDELARWILGEPNRFLEGAAALRRNLS